MYICLCQGVTDKQIKKVVLEKRITRLSELNRETGACGQCGKCAKDSKKIMESL